ncbi:hypothetical protein [Nocardia grenadensis]|uniref:hypothetical protein n=1 Tax=Nocardia grenadensis TaxID=931537 RepID=UPI003D94E523
MLSFESEARTFETVRRLGGFGAEPVPTENPYWATHGALAFPDPDGRQVVLVPRPVF